MQAIPISQAATLAVRPSMLVCQSVSTYVLSNAFLYCQLNALPSTIPVCLQETSRWWRSWVVPWALFHCQSLHLWQEILGRHQGRLLMCDCAHAADLNCLKVPEGMSDKKVVLLSDVLPTAWHSTELGGVGKGDRVAIWGAGPGVTPNLHPDIRSALPSHLPRCHYHSVVLDGVSSLGSGGIACGLNMATV